MIGTVLHREVIAASLCVAAACTNLRPDKEEAMNDPRQSLLMQLEHEMFDALRGRDAVQLRRLLAEEFELRMPGQAPIGREAFIASVQAIPGEILEVGSEDVEGRILSDVGVLTGHQRARVRLADGSQITQVGAFSDVARWIDGRWVLVQAYTVNVSETVEAP